MAIVYIKGLAQLFIYTPWKRRNYKPAVSFYKSTPFIITLYLTYTTWKRKKY